MVGTSGTQDSNAGFRKPEIQEKKQGFISSKWGAGLDFYKIASRLDLEKTIDFMDSERGAIFLFSEFSARITHSHFHHIAVQANAASLCTAGRMQGNARL